MESIYKIHEDDNVAVALLDLKKGQVQRIDGKDLLLSDDVHEGHKIALKNLRNGDKVIKYGFPIGHATQEVKRGQFVHTHNLATNLDTLISYCYSPCCDDRMHNKNDIYEELTFRGYRRKNGEAGVRNELWVVPTVGCINGIAEIIVQRFCEEAALLSIDAVEFLRHDYGCSQLGEDHRNTQRILGNIVKHPNAGGVLVLGLGCENNKLEYFKDALGDYDSQRVRFLETQKVGDEVEEGLRALKELYNVMKDDRRSDVPISQLRIGLKCGGSDGFSGITANPLLGVFSDILIEYGGTTVLTEVPEMFGAETILMARAEDKNIFSKTVDLIDNFKKYYQEYHQPIYENPSPGNKDGGISTQEEKSLGCVQKAGKAPVVDVLQYTDRIKKQGLNLLNAPGNDLVSTTALGACGCQIVLFTTGRGTPYGSFIPTVKVSTNTQLFQRKPHWIDFDAGRLLTGQSKGEVGTEFLRLIIDIASGQPTNNEKNRFKNIAIFKTGVTL